MKENRPNLAERMIHCSMAKGGGKEFDRFPTLQELEKVNKNEQFYVLVIPISNPHSEQTVLNSMTGWEKISAASTPSKLCMERKQK